MWPNRRLLDLFKIAHPVIQAPMAGLGTVELAAAVCEAGGLGSLGCATLQPALAEATIRKLQALTHRPINVNFFCHTRARADAGRERAWHDRLSPYYRELGIGREPPPPRTDIPPFDDAMCEVVERTRPAVVSFHFGLPAAALLTRLKAAGCRVMSSATTVEEARWLQARGVDAVIAQGSEAGGHRAMFLAADPGAAAGSQPGTMVLVPQIADAIDVPVIAAGGIADGRGIAAAFALGASGAQLGTAFLFCPEAATPPLHREALKQAGADATVLTNVFTGRPARALANRFAVEVGPMLEKLPDFPLAMAEGMPLRAKAEQHGSSDFTPLWSGQSAALGKTIPAGELIALLIKETLGQFDRLRNDPAD